MEQKIIKAEKFLSFVTVAIVLLWVVLRSAVIVVWLLKDRQYNLSKIIIRLITDFKWHNCKHIAIIKILLLFICAYL